MHRDSDKGAQAALANRSSVARIHTILVCVQKLFKRRNLKQHYGSSQP